MKKASIIGIASLSLTSFAALVGVKLMPGGAMNADFQPMGIGDPSYSLLFDSSIAITEGQATAKTALNNDFSITLTDSEASVGAFCKLNKDGTIVGSTPIKGLTAITVDYESGGELVAGFGGSNPHPLPDRAVADDVRLESGYAKGAQYFAIHAAKDTIINSIQLEYECIVPDLEISSLRVESSVSKDMYLVGDEAVSSDFAVYAVFGTGGDQRLYSDEYTVSLDTSTVGSKKATITYLADNSKTVEADVRVWSYAATASDIEVDAGKVYVTVSGTYDGVTQEEFGSMNWEADFQKHGTLNGDDNWDRVISQPAFTLDDGTWSYKVDVTSFEGYYTAHLKNAPHTVDGDNDLKISGDWDDSERVTLGEKDYLLNYNLGKSADVDCWGCLGLKVFNHMNYEIIGSFDGWTGTSTDVSGSGRYNMKYCYWEETTSFKFRQEGVWNENAWGYDQIDWESCPYGIVKRGSGDGDNNVIIAKGSYMLYLDLWTKTPKIVFGNCNPFYGLVGNVNGQEWNVGWENDIEMPRYSDVGFVANSVNMTSGAEFKVRIGQGWSFESFGYDQLAGSYTRLVHKGTESGHENNICVNDDYLGNYDVVLNYKTGKLALFRENTTFSVCGSFNSWGDTDMTKDENIWSATVDLTEGDLFKIRGDHDWGYEFDWNNIGEYPEGAFEKKEDGTDIFVKKPGRYEIYLVRTTGLIYIFEA